MRGMEGVGQRAGDQRRRANDSAGVADGEVPAVLLPEQSPPLVLQTCRAVPINGAGDVEARRPRNTATFSRRGPSMGTMTLVARRRFAPPWRRPGKRHHCRGSCISRSYLAKSEGRVGSSRVDHRQPVRHHGPAADLARERAVVPVVQGQLRAGLYDAVQAVAEPLEDRTM